MDIRHRNLVLLAISIGSILNPLIASMITLTLPAIGVDFTVSARDLGWMTTAFILANAISVIPATRLVDKIGYKKSYIIGAVIVAFTCFISIFAPNYPILITLRIIAGCSISLITITGIAIITRIFPKEKRGFVLGINTAMVYVGGSFGPVLGGFLTDSFGWRSVFLFISPFLLVASTMLFFFLKQEFKERVEHFDWKGSIIYAAGIFCLMYGLSTITEFSSIILAAAGLLLIIAFGIFELKQKYPVLDVGLFFRNARFTRSALAAFLNYGAMYGSVYFVSLYLQSVGSLSATQAGFVILFQPIIQAFMTPVAGKISDKTDTKYIATAGMIMTTIGILILTGLGITSTGSIVLIMVTQTFIGLGTAFFSAPNMSAIMGSVTPKDYSTASGIVTVARTLGMLLSMAVCMATISVFVGGTELLNPDMYPEFVLALQVAMYICAGLSFVGIFFSWFRGKELTI